MSKVLVSGNYDVLIYCHGCKIPHWIGVGGLPGRPNWTWNDSLDKPTFRPSLMLNKDLSNPTKPRCHSYITDGQIRFLDDSTHELTGQTVELPEYTWGDE